MKKLSTLFLGLLLISLVSALNTGYHVNIQVTDNSDNIIPSTLFNFNFLISNLTDCSNPILNKSISLASDSRGIVSYDLNVSMTPLKDYYFCYYRDGVLKSNRTIFYNPNIPQNLSQFNNDLNIISFNESYTDSKYINLSGTNANQNIEFGLFNVSATWFKGIFNWIIGSGSNYLSFNGTVLNFNETNLNNTINISINSKGYLTSATANNTYALNSSLSNYITSTQGNATYALNTSLINYYLNSNPNSYLNTTSIDNSTIARIGNCPAGQAVVNTTTSGVQCSVVASSSNLTNVAFLNNTQTFTGTNTFKNTITANAISSNATSNLSLTSGDTAIKLNAGRVFLGTGGAGGLYSSIDGALMVGYQSIPSGATQTNGYGFYSGGFCFGNALNCVEGAGENPWFYFTTKNPTNGLFFKYENFDKSAKREGYAVINSSAGVGQTWSSEKYFDFDGYGCDDSNKVCEFRVHSQNITLDTYNTYAQSSNFLINNLSAKSTLVNGSFDAKTQTVIGDTNLNDAVNYLVDASGNALCSGTPSTACTSYGNENDCNANNYHGGCGWDSANCVSECADCSNYDNNKPGCDGYTGCTWGDTGSYCGGSHTGCTSYGEGDCATHGCTPNYNPGSCSGSTGGCTSWDDCAGCSDEPSCTSCGGGWTPQSWAGCTGDPHTCQQSECDAQTDGCSNTWSGTCSIGAGCGSGETCPNSCPSGCSNDPADCYGTATCQQNQGYCEAESGCTWGFTPLSLTLPQCSNNPFREYTTKKVDATNAIVKVVPQAGETIDGAVEKNLTYQYESATYVCKDSNWSVISEAQFVFDGSYLQFLSPIPPRFKDVYADNYYTYSDIWDTSKRGSALDSIKSDAELLSKGGDAGRSSFVSGTKETTIIVGYKNVTSKYCNPDAPWVCYDRTTKEPIYQKIQEPVENVINQTALLEQAIYELKVKDINKDTQILDLQNKVTSIKKCAELKSYEEYQTCILKS